MKVVQKQLARQEKLLDSDLSTKMFLIFKRLFSQQIIL